MTGLSIGMAAAILIFIWVQNELSFDSYHADAKNIYRITNYISGDKSAGVESSPYPMGEEAKQKVQGVVAVTRFRPYGVDPAFFNIKGEFFREDHAAYVDAEWFNVFNYGFVYGNAAAFNSSPYSVALTESKAKKYFGNGNPVGKSVRIDTIEYTVQAVLKDNPANSSFHYDILLPYAVRALSARNRNNDAQWGNYGYVTFLKLLPTADRAKVAGALKNIINTARETTQAEVALLPLPAMHFEKIGVSRLQHGNMRMVYVFAALGILVLAIACINYMNLTTARASVRMKEVSVKKIMGAERRHLFLQFVVESALIGLISLSVAAVLLKLGLPWFNTFTERQFILSDSLSTVALIFTGTFILSLLLTSIYPALLLSSFNPISVFRGRSIFKMKDVVLRKSLVVVQFTVSIVLIVGTICIYRQMQFIQEQNTSYDKSQLFTFTIPYRLIRDLESEEKISLTSSIKQALLKESSIENVSLMGQESVVDMQNQSASNNNDWIGKPKDFRPFIAFFDVDTSFTTMLNLQVKEGRWFLPGSQADKHNVVLNETAVAEFGLKEPVVGQYFAHQGDTGVVAGVVKDFYYKSMHEKIGPVVLRIGQENNNSFLVKTSSAGVIQAKDATEKIWKRFFPSEPFTFSFADEEFENIYRADHKASILVLIFSLLTILISCLGLYGLAAFTAEHRRKEIGIRKVLGASIAGIIGLLSKDFLKLVFIAILIASPIAWWAMNKWLEEFAYRINIGWWMFAAAGAIALVIAFLSIGFRSASAAGSNPVKALRTE